MARGTFCFHLAIMTLLGVTVGCGGPKRTIKVSGKVTVNGEQPPGPGTISFTVVQPATDYPNRPAMAKFDTDGIYSATSYEQGDGLVPGSYKVAVECYETPPNMDGKPVVSHIDKKYMNGETSGLEVTVDPKSKPIVFDISLE